MDPSPLLHIYIESITSRASTNQPYRFCESFGQNTVRSMKAHKYSVLLMYGDVRAKIQNTKFESRFSLNFRT